MNPNLLTQKTPIQNHKHKHVMSSDFKQILANQHNKHFHLVDHPDLVFQLANHSFHPQTQQNSIQSKSSSQQRKFYRHKSQQQINVSESDLQNLILSKKSTSKLINSNNIDSPSFSKQNNKFLNGQIKMRKIDFVKEKSTDKEGLKKIASNNSLTQKQNLLSKTQSLNRPLTSNSKVMKSQYNFKLMPQLFSKLASQSNQVNKNTWKQNFERKKYGEMKQKLSNLIKEIQSQEDFKFSQVFQYEQIILRDYLSSLVTELKKECIQKGELIQMIWNTFLVLINKVMKLMLDQKKSVQKSQIQEQLNLHSSYQQMYLFQTTKIKQLGKKYNESKNVIDRLIFELRYKRKEVRKLSKNLAICNEKLNEYKIQHIDLQNQHIDLLIDSKKLNQEQATQVLQRKLQINRLKYLKEKVGLKKNQLKFIIQQELQQEKLKPQEEEMFKKQLFEKINSNTKKKTKKITFFESKQQTNLIQQFIEKFSSKFIQPLPDEGQSQENHFIRRPHKATTAINTDFGFQQKSQLFHGMTQTSFSDKIQFQIINTRSTQTPGTQKIKKTQTVSVQANGDQMKILLTKARMMIYQTTNISLYFDISKDSKNQRRRSSLQFKKQFLNNKSISQLSSEHSESKQKNFTQKRESKNFKKSGFDKKTSILGNTLQNYSNFRQSNNRFQTNKNGGQIKKMNKKRVTETLFIQDIKTQESQKIRRQSRQKKRIHQSPSLIQNQKIPDRSSVCMSNLDSLIGNISMNEEKQKYIENYILSKEQQFQILQENAIMQTYTDYLKQKEPKKSSFFNDSKKKLRTSQITQNGDKNNGLNTDLSQEKPIEQILSSCQKLNQQSQSFKRNSKRQSRQMSPSLKNFYDGSLQAQRKSTNQKYLLNKIIEFTVRKSLIKRKLDSSNFNQCKQKSEFVSITQKLDPFMLDVEYLMTQNFNRKKKQNLINIKSINKFIMMTYSRSIDRLYRNNYLLQNLIKPLFQCFQMIYGALKPQQIYKKMVSAISDILSVKQNQNFKEFIFFLGLDKENLCSPYLTTFDVCLYLKLLEKLNLGGKFSSEIDSLFTSKQKVTTELKKILQSQKLSAQVVYIIESKIKSILTKFQDYVRESIDSEGQSKINLFKVSRIIVEEIIKIRIHALNKIQSFIDRNFRQESKNILEVRNSYVDCQKVKNLLDCCRILTTRKLYFNKMVEQLSIKQENNDENEKKIKKSELGILLLRVGVVDFSQLEMRMKYVHENINQQAIHKVQNEEKQQLSLDIQKLSKVQMESNRVLHEILGQVQPLYELGLLKGLQSFNNNNNNF